MRRAAMQAPVGLRKPLNRALQIRLGQGERQTHEALERTVDREARSWRDTQAQALGHCRERRSVRARKLRPKRQPALGYGRTPMRQCVGKQRSEEHTSELQSLMRISYAVFCLKKKKTHKI